MVLISVIGDFYSSVIPVFYEFSNKISKHIIVYDDFKNDVQIANKIISGTKKFISAKKLNIHTVAIKIDEDSMGALNATVKKIQSYLFPHEELYINTTDGLFNIGFVLAKQFASHGAKVISYDRYDNEYNVLDGDSMQTLKIHGSIPIKEHFMLKNIVIESYTDVNILTQSFKESLKILFEKYEGDKQKYKNISAQMKKTKLGVLYEYYIYSLVSQLDFDDILLGVKIRDYFDEKMYVENELDILIMKENHLHVIECKFWNEYDMIPLIYKLDSIRSTLDEDANVLAVTNHNNYQIALDYKGEVKMPYRRANVKKIYLRGSPIQNIREFLKDVDKIFKLNTQNLQEKLEALPQLLPYNYEERQRMQNELYAYLQKRLQTAADIFQPAFMHKFQNYRCEFMKVEKQIIPILEKDEHLRELLHMLHARIVGGKDVHIEEIYKFYVENFKTK